MYDYRKDIHGILDHTSDDPNSLIASAYAIKSITSIIINEVQANNANNNQENARHWLNKKKTANQC